MNTIIKMLSVLTLPERKSGMLLLFLTIIMALFEVVGVASIMPFLAVLTNPDLIQTNTFLKKLYESVSPFGINNSKDFLFFLGLVVFILLILALTMRSLTVYLQINFVLMREHSISKRLTKLYLSQDYSWFLNQNSADLGKTILSEVGNFIGNGLLPLTIFISQATVTIALVTLLVIIDPLIAAYTGVFFSLVYGLILLITGGRLKRLGASSVQANKDRYTAINEAFGTIKVIKAGGWEETFTNRYSKASRTYAESYATARIIEQTPRFLIEGLVFGGMLMIILFAMKKSDNLSSILPIIAVYTFASYRLLPAMQQIYAALSQLRFVNASVETIYNNLNSLKLKKEIILKENPIHLQNSIILSKISYTYPNAKKKSLTDIDLNIPLGNKIAFVGSTGSGKTTLVDIISGLLIPQQGSLIIDKDIINRSNLRLWQNSIGYVSQDIVLTDDTISSNIAFGLEIDKIDQKQVEYVAKIANIHEFIINDIPKGYAAKVGERGMRLSGGQRQRIGIARALYRKPKILILDEATSALDNLTEKTVMESIGQFSHKVTVIIIAHSLITTKHCDRIYFLESGKLINEGTYDSLKINDEKFRKMANIK